MYRARTWLPQWKSAVIVLSTLSSPMAPAFGNDANFFITRVICHNDNPGVTVDDRVGIMITLVRPRCPWMTPDRSNTYPMAPSALRDRHPPLWEQIWNVRSSCRTISEVFYTSLNANFAQVNIFCAYSNSVQHCWRKWYFIRRCLIWRNKQQHQNLNIYILRWVLWSVYM